MSLAQKRPALNPPAAILPAKFDNQTVTGHTSLNYMENFKQKINFHQMLKSGISYNKHYNARYSTTDTLEFMVDAAIQGFSRFNHMDELRWDNAYLQLKDQAPSEKVCRDLLLDLPSGTKSELRLVNKQLLTRKAQISLIQVVVAVTTAVILIILIHRGFGSGRLPISSFFRTIDCTSFHISEISGQ